MLALVEALRPHQWTKNLILFAPLLFAQQLSEPNQVARAVASFLIFCLLSGAVYLINDLRDFEQDRRHPVKSRRPLASGRLGRGPARIATGVILAVSLAAAFALSPELMTKTLTVHPGTAVPMETAQPSFLVLALTYVGLHVAYTYWLKHVVILDAMVIAMGFVVRAAAGAAAIAVGFSHWLLICTIFLALFLALAKRRHELVLLADEASEHRRTLGDYDASLLDQMIGIVAGACVISYALYTMAPATMTKFGTARLNFTIPFVIYGLFRYLYLIHRQEGGGDPSASLLTDRPILLTVALWGATVIAVLYL